MASSNKRQFLMIKRQSMDVPRQPWASCQSLPNRNKRRSEPFGKATNLDFDLSSLSLASQSDEDKSIWETSSCTQNESLGFIPENESTSNVSFASCRSFSTPTHTSQYDTHSAFNRSLSPMETSQSSLPSDLDSPKSSARYVPPPAASFPGEVIQQGEAPAFGSNATQGSHIGEKPNPTEAVVSSSSNNNNISLNESSVRLKADHGQKPSHCRRFPWCHCLAVSVVCIGIALLACKDMVQVLCERNLHFNVTAFRGDLDGKVYGQHIAVDAVTTALESFFIPQQPKNVTVFFFHGWTGIGKNHLSNILAENMPSQRPVHKIIVPLHFPHKVDQEAHMADIFHWITTNVSSCAVNLFLIDELDKASDGFLTGLENALRALKNGSYDLPNSRTIVVLISNADGTLINRYVLEQMMEQVPRQSITRDNILAFMTSHAKAHQVSSWHLDMLSREVVDHVVPFLPLGRSHIAQCIKRHMSLLGKAADRDIIKSVMREITFFPDGLDYFSSSGCRKVAAKVDLFLD